MIHETAADTANQIASAALVVALVAALIALFAAGFTALQAVTAHRARLADNEGTVVEWTQPEWVAADTVQFGSKGPDIAWRVWARFNVDGRESVQRARRLRPGDMLRFKITGHETSWDWHVRQRAKPGEQRAPSAAFYYGGLITWRNRYGRRYSAPIDGAIVWNLRANHEPYPHNEKASEGSGS